MCANRSASAQYLGHNIAVDVGQPKVAAGVSIDQPGVVDSHEVQDRRVVVVDVNRILATMLIPNSSVSP